MRIASIYGGVNLHARRRTCPVCGKAFWCGHEWAYRFAGDYYCSWTCYRIDTREEGDEMRHARYTHEFMAQVLAQRAGGKSVAEIAQKYGWTEKSTSTNLGRFARRLREAGAAQAAAEPAAPPTEEPAPAAEPDKAGAPAPVILFDQVSSDRRPAVDRTPADGADQPQLTARAVIRLCFRMLDVLEQAIEQDERRTRG